MEAKRLVMILLAFGAVAFICWLLSLHHKQKRSYPVVEKKDDHKKIRSALDSLGPMIKLDPVRHCQVYKHHGCSHVDGFLCNVETCDIKVNGMGTMPIKKE